MTPQPSAYHRAAFGRLFFCPLQPCNHGGMKDIIQCSGCSQCGRGYGTGFTGGTIMRCLLMDVETTKEDGCTHGAPGEPIPLVCADDVYLNGYEAVKGWHERI